MSRRNRIRFTENKNDSITDIEVLLNEYEYQNLLRKFPQTSRHWQTSCYTYIVQSELAKYNSNHAEGSYSLDIQAKIDLLMLDLRYYTEAYGVFEVLINNPPSLNPTENLTMILAALQNHLDWLQQSTMPSYFKFTLITQTQAFQKKIHALNAKVVTRDECRKIFSIQNEDPEIPSIGAFVADQMWHIANQGIQNIYEITDEYAIHNTSKHKLWNRIKQILFFKMHPALKALSDAKANIEVKGRSFHGIRFNNSKSPIPQNMLESLGPIPEEQAKSEKKWTSLNQFVSNLNDLEKLDEILSTIKELDEVDEMSMAAHANDTKQPHSAFQILVFGANILELCIVLATRIPFVVLSTALHLFLVRPIEAIASKFTKEPFDFLSRGLNQLNQTVADLHHNHSLVRQAKNNRNQHYVLKNKILNRVKLNANSLYCTILDEFSSEKVSYYIINGLKSLGRTINIFYKDPRYLMITAGQKRSEDLVHAYQQEISQNFFALLNDKLNFTQDPLVGEETSVYKKRNKIDAWKTNSMELPIDFFVEIFVGLPDAVIGPMFRKSPGAATLFFMLSNASLAALFAAPEGGKLASALSLPPSILSKLFTGKEVSESITAKVIAVFLQWKIGFFSSEALASILKGDYEFLKELFHEPEKITLSLSILIAAGWAMQFIPELPEEIPFPFVHTEIPNVYAYFINLFIEESRECAHGQWPANFLEYAFLSLKFGFLCAGFLSGTHKTLITDIISDIKQVILEHRLSAEAGFELNLGHFTAILDKHHITETHDLYLPLLQALQKAAKDNSTHAENIREKAQETSDELFETLFHLIEEDIDFVLDDLQRSTAKLLKALQTVQKMGILGEPFKSLTDARLFFDSLARTFEDYNACQRKRGHFDKQLDNEYLLSFYNKYCYKGSNNFLRLLSIFPFYPITKFSQAVQKLLATYVFDAPSTLYKVAKSEAKDAVILSQLVAMMGRIAHELIRAYAYSARALVCIVAVPCAILGGLLTTPGLFFQFNPLLTSIWIMNIAIDFASTISPHRSRGLVGKTLEANYAHNAHIASTNSDDMSLQHSRVMDALLHFNPTRRMKSEAKEADFHDLLAEYNQKREKRFFSSNPKRPAQLERLSAIHDPLILDKAEKIKSIQDEMENSSLLKETCSEIILSVNHF